MGTTGASKSRTPPPLTPPQPAAGLPASGKAIGDANPGRPGFGWGRGAHRVRAITSGRRSPVPAMPWWLPRRWPVAGFSSRLSRKARIVCAGTTVACGCRVGVPIVATTCGLSCAMPRKRLPVERGGAGEADLRRGFERGRRATCAVAVEIALPPPWVCGSAMPTSTTLGPRPSVASAAGARSGAP